MDALQHKGTYSFIQKMCKILKFYTDTYFILCVPVDDHTYTKEYF